MLAIAANAAPESAWTHDTRRIAMPARASGPDRSDDADEAAFSNRIGELSGRRGLGLERDRRLGGRPHQRPHAPPIKRQKHKSGNERQGPGDQQRLARQTRVDRKRRGELRAIGHRTVEAHGRVQMILCFRAEAVLMEQHIELKMAGNEIDRLAHAVRAA